MAGGFWDGIGTVRIVVKTLYFDYNATTPLDHRVAEVFAQSSAEYFGNASSMHRHGQQAREQLDRARACLAGTMGASAGEIVFTSGGTESNNLAINGLLRALPSGPKHIVTSTIEHPAVSEVIRQIGDTDVQVSRVQVNSDGLISATDVEQQLRPDTVLVSIMHANNETGMIQPIAEVGRIVKARQAAGQNIFHHSDGVQSLGKIPIDVGSLGVDLYSVSAHKVYGPKGTGALYVRKGTPLAPIHFGGKHEHSRRAGTENVAGAIAFARAVELCTTEDAESIRRLRDRFEQAMLKSAVGAERNGGETRRLPNTSNLCFRGISAESLLISLDMRGIAVSTGSACSSGSIEASPALLAMGLTRAQARASVRFSFGRGNTDADIEQLSAAVVEAVGRLEKAYARRSLLHV